MLSAAEPVSPESLTRTPLPHPLELKILPPEVQH